jgi:uncharacterized protein (TIGR02679 family)
MARTMSEPCALCDGACVGADLAPLLDPRMAWLWEQVGRAGDRRGDSSLTTGALQLCAPQEAEQRAAVVGLVGERPLKPGQLRRVDLESLTVALRRRGPTLSPGAVAAHALGRRLAARAAIISERENREAELEAAFTSAAAQATRAAFSSPASVWRALRRSGAVGRLLAAEQAESLVRSAFAVIAGLPAVGARIDRRRLASDATGDPHALDHGSPLAGAALAILAAAGIIAAGQRPRDAWSAVGVDCDDLLGGLIAVGIAPLGWSLPRGAVVTLPPRVLTSCQWSRPDGAGWIFVTENPSIAGAAAELGLDHLRLLCTSGTPSAVEIAAIARLAAAGWSIAVRADFDVAGLGHVLAILRGVPGSIPWRMRSSDYVDSLVRAAATTPIPLGTIANTPWDPDLAEVMRARGSVAYEESLLPLLLDDLARARPPETSR